MVLFVRQALKRCRNRKNIKVTTILVGFTFFWMVAFVLPTATALLSHFNARSWKTSNRYSYSGRHVTTAARRNGLANERFVARSGGDGDGDGDGQHNDYIPTSSFRTPKFHTLDSVRRVFCISDLHTDHLDNLQWLRDQCRGTPATGGGLQENDLVVVAGDISHDLPTFRDTLQILQAQSCHVLFLPGNHEAWLTSLPRQRTSSSSSSSSANNVKSQQDNWEPQDSLEKLDQMYSICREMGIWTETLLIGSSDSYPLWLVPLQSWYDGTLSLEGCDDLCRNFGRWPWVDFQRCQWPQPFLPEPAHSENPRIPRGLNDFFLQRNQNSLEYVAQQINSPTTITTRAGANGSSRPASVMTISHFLPNQQCLPDWKDVESSRFLRKEWLDHGAAEISAKFAKVAGSARLDEQIRSTLHASSGGTSLRHIHVFGHSHRPKDFEYKGIRYIHNPLGKPRERQLHMVNPKVKFQLVWDSHLGEIPAETTVIRYWEEQGGGKEALRRRMAKPSSRVSATTSGSTTSSTTLVQEQVLRVTYTNSSQLFGLYNSTTAAVTTSSAQSSSSASCTAATAARVVVMVSDNNSTAVDSAKTS